MEYGSTYLLVLNIQQFGFFHQMTESQAFVLVFSLQNTGSADSQWLKDWDEQCFKAKVKKKLSAESQKKKFKFDLARIIYTSVSSTESPLTILIPVNFL